MAAPVVARPRVLLTAFAPFGAETINPSIAVAAAVAAAPPDGAQLRTLVLPVVYARAWPELLAALRHHAPDLLLMLGLAGGRAGLSIERVVINLDDSPIADTAGEQRVETPILQDGPAAYFVTVPTGPMLRAARRAGVEAAISLSAGTFLCNHVLYRACHHAATTSAALRCGFIHLPWLPEQAATHPGSPAMSLPAMAAGVRLALAACLDPAAAAA